MQRSISDSVPHLAYRNRLFLFQWLLVGKRDISYFLESVFFRLVMMHIELNNLEGERRPSEVLLGFAATAEILI